jgi:hypothetical protein
MTAVSHEGKRSERRLAIARRLFRAMVAKDPDRSITLCDSRGEVVARTIPGLNRALQTSERRAQNEKSRREVLVGPVGTKAG